MIPLQPPADLQRVEQIREMLQNAPHLIPPLEAIGVFRGDMRRLITYAPDLVKPYLKHGWNNQEDGVNVKDEISALLNKPEVIDSIPATVELLDMLRECNYTRNYISSLESIFLDCVLRYQPGLSETLMDELERTHQMVSRCDYRYNHALHKEGNMNALGIVMQSINRWHHLRDENPEKAPQERFFSDCQNVIQHIISLGVDLEAPCYFHGIKTGDVKQYQSALDLAYQKHQQEFGNPIFLNLLISCGADWKNFLQRTNTSQRAKDVILSLPPVRQMAFGEMAQHQQHLRAVDAPKPKF